MSENKQQELAIHSGIQSDILISAGAGSGKTFTLTKKVAEDLKNGLKTSELLVLTFTNKAAHQMKEKIINKIKSKEIESAHIQTFDSFAFEIVSSYAAQLGMSSNISVIDKNIINSKKTEFLDEILEDEFKNNSKEITKLLRCYNLYDDWKTRQVILDIHDQLGKMTYSKKKAFINFVKKEQFTKEKFNEMYDGFINHYKNLIKRAIYEAYYVLTKDIELNDENLLDFYKKFDDISWLQDDYTQFEFDQTNNVVYKKLLELLELGSEEFVKKAKEYRKGTDQFLPMAKKDYNKFVKNYLDDKKQKQIYDIFRNLFSSEDAILLPIFNLDDYDKEWQKYESGKANVIQILSIIEKLDKKIDTYKQLSNSYTFSDIANKALELLKEDKYVKSANEIRNRYKYIMVDEYQDTNDLQEDFINSLLFNEKGKRISHLFCVGDAKQSIYAWRNSNLELFKNRRNMYKNDKKLGTVIPMNTNYRSCQKVIDDINYIFSYYMTLDHGAISYNTVDEKLECGNPDVKNDSFGLTRFYPKRRNSSISAKQAQLWEIHAIIEDIKSKVGKFQVVDCRTKEKRKCEYSDIYILTRVATGFEMYKKEFLKYGIPLNNEVASILSDYTPIIVIQSIISIIDVKLNDPTNKARLEHLFASLARSYIYQKDDQYVFDEISKKDIYNNEIIKEVYDFAEQNKSLPLNSIFTKLLDHFGIVEKLYLIGAASDNVGKIESLYDLAIKMENTTDGLNGLVDLLQKMKKHRIDLSTDSTIEVENAVHLMTIHKSKGLENKIVYLPCSFNHLGGFDPRKAPDYEFNKDLGIFMPYYEFSEDKTISVQTIGKKYLDILPNHINIDEHVRLYYVALTRAENCIYIVGQESSKNELTDRNSETLYGMLYHIPHFSELNPDLPYSAAGCEELYQRYISAVSIFKKMVKKYSLDSFDWLQNNHNFLFNQYIYLWNKYYYLKLLNYIQDLIDNIIDALFKANVNDEILKDNEFLEKLFVKHYFNAEYYGKKELEKLLSDNVLRLKRNDNDYPTLINKNNFNEYLQNFVTALKNSNATFKKTEDKLSILEKMFQIRNKLDYVLRISFKNEQYEDKVEYKDINLAQEDNKKKPKLDDLNINNDNIEFPIRQHNTASVSDPDVEQEVLDRGTYMHRLMELVNLRTKDTSFIKNPDDKIKIDNVLKINVLNNIDKDTKIFKEFGYYDEISDTKGFIDLLLVKSTECIIIDYKLANLDKNKYKSQLEIYERNVKSLYPKKKISKYLISLEEGWLRPI